MAMNLRLDMLEMDVHSQRDSEERGERERGRSRRRRRKKRKWRKKRRRRKTVGLDRPRGKPNTTVLLAIK